MLEDHPFLARLLRECPTLRRAEDLGSHRVLATYWLSDGRCPFAFCVEGLLIDPAHEARFVAFSEIEDSGYYNVELLKRSKHAKTAGETLDEVLPLKLHNGESIDLPLARRDDGMSERLAIGHLVEQRVRLHRHDIRRAAS